MRAQCGITTWRFSFKFWRFANRRRSVKRSTRRARELAAPSPPPVLPPPSLPRVIMPRWRPAPSSASDRGDRTALECAFASKACPLNPRPVPLQGQQELVQDFSERFSPAIRGVVEFAKRLPGFQQLPQEDQVTLLKAGVFEVLLVRLAGMFDARTNTMLCLNGQLLRREALHTSVNARFLMDSMFDFAERVNSLSLSDAELALFCAVVVFVPRPGPAMLSSWIACRGASSTACGPFRRSLGRLPLLVEHGTESSVGSPSSSYTADEAMRSPVSCSESICSGESASSGESLCGSEVSGYTELRPPFPLVRRRHDHSEGASSGDEASESPLKCPFSKRKSESPDDSGIESGTDRSDKLSSPSVCSSPRSSIDEKSEEDREDDMPVLRRAPAGAPHHQHGSAHGEAYNKPHKKFRPQRREEEPHSSQPTSSLLEQTLSQPPHHQTSSLAATHATLASTLASTLSSPSLAASHSTLARTLLEGSKISEDAMRRADILHSMIMRTEVRERLPTPRVSPAPYYVPQPAVDRPRLHLLTTPTPSRYYESRMSATPVGLGAQPSGSPSASTMIHSGLGAQPGQREPSPLVELQVDIADSQPLNLSKKTPPPTPREFVMEACRSVREGPGARSDVGQRVQRLTGDGSRGVAACSRPTRSSSHVQGAGASLNPP
ncbi:ecdysteroid receptor E75 [Penaeus vannamei]|uniref:Ecdysteroid receptor E75 n=1 Tax=Penaeus vannamei TaxID=6689 RepID=A0A423TLT8_PENVA|nr:ecdysteroid receptor E75 [Penaeus vannamei]